MSRTATLLALLAALALPAAAAAKEPTEVKVCGASDCRTIETHDIAYAEGAGPTDPPTAAPFYTTRLTMQMGPGRETSWSSAWVPARNAVRARDTDNGGWTWIEASPQQAAALRDATRGLTPFPASALRGARPADDGGIDWRGAIGIALAAMAAAAAGALVLSSRSGAGRGLRGRLRTLRAGPGPSA